MKSGKGGCEVAWLNTCFFLLLFATTSIPSTTATVSYSDHCASVVPEATPTFPEQGTLLSIRTVTSQCKGGDRILGKNSSFSFYPNKAVSGDILTKYATSTAGVYTVEGRVRFSSSNSFYLMSNSTPRNPTHSRFRARLGSLSFQLNGLWSQSSGKLCVVGSGSWYTKEGNHLNLDAVLKLNFAKNSSISTSLVTGLLESLSFPNKTTYFEPISILAFPPMKQYQYTLLSEESVGFSGGDDVPTNSSLSLRPGGICSMLSWRFSTFKLKYESTCMQNCTPLGDTIGYVPTLMSLYAIQCSEDEQKLRYLIEFPNNSYVSHSRAFDHIAALVGEGTWDGRKNQLAVVACRILDATSALSSAHLGDCSIRLSLRYPATWSIGKSMTIEGQIWTNKTTNDSGYFDKITFQNSDNSVTGAPGVKYEYTEMERVKRSCQAQKPVKKKRETYPEGNSSDMRFDFSVKSSQGNTAWGYAAPIFVGDQFYEERDSVFISDSVMDFSEVQSLPAVEEKTSSTGPVNISYIISLRPLNGVKLGGGTYFFNQSLSPNRQAEIWAEGVYDEETGHLCMVGCRSAGSVAESLDCEILVKFQFPPVNGKNQGTLKGSIESTRRMNDSLYFDHLDVSSTALYFSQAKRFIWRMGFEITMVLISNTLICIFAGLQLFYLKKHPDAIPFISLLMLLILTLGHMIPLVLNFEALFLENHNKQNVLFGSGGWLEVNEVIVRVFTMVAFLLQFRLLQLVWISRVGNGKEKGLWGSEKKTLLVSLPLYVLGGFIALFVNWKRNKYSPTYHVAVYQEHSLWGDLRSYGGLVLDGFLLPQILLNIFQMSKESALSHSFYVGTTFVHLLPHAYDLYRAHNYVHRHVDGSYIYANPSADFYSAASDVIIPCGGMLFAGAIYLQQRFGGRCFLPGRFRKSEVYEKVPVVSSD